MGEPIVLLKIDVTSSCDELFRDGLISSYDRVVDRGTHKPPEGRSYILELLTYENNRTLLK